ncbi:MAG: MAG0480 family ComEC-like protein [Metamycoplasmataceae bacterium]
MRWNWLNSRNWTKSIRTNKKSINFGIAFFNSFLIVIFSFLLWKTDEKKWLIPLIFCIFIICIYSWKMLLIIPIFIFTFFGFYNLKNINKIDYIYGNYKVVDKIGKSSIIESKNRKIILSKNYSNIGDLINLKKEAKIEKIINLKNDFHKYLLSKNITYICNQQINFNLIENKKNWWENISSFFIRGPTFYIKYVPLLLLGIKNENTNLVYEKTKDLGIVHLIVISGFHINFIIIFITKFLKFLKIKDRESNFIALIIILFYLLIIKFPIPALRAYLFSLAIFLNKNLFKNKIDNLTFLTLISTLFMLINPFIIFNISFIFSFIISFTIIFMNKITRNKIFKLIIIFMISSPIIIHLNQKINYLSLFYSIFFSPIIIFSYMINFLFFPFKELLNNYYYFLDELINIVNKIPSTINIKINQNTIDYYFITFFLWFQFQYWRKL